MASAIALSLAFLALVLSMTGAADAAGMQRMVLAPGCYRLAAGKYDDVSAYCLDQSREAPRSGSILSSAPAGLGDTVIKAADGTPIALATALARHIVQIEGLGNQFQLRVRNLTDHSVEICVNGPSVVMGNGETYTGDVAQIYPQIAHLVASPGKQPAGRARDGADSIPPAHADLQQKLWEMVDKVETAEDKAWLQKNAVAPELRLPLPKAPVVAPGQSECVGQASSLTICVE
jgi:hypothetical protein